ncbi:MAG: hypothetical protein ACPGQS_01070 [Bradymonadia bacterium]
MHKLNNKILALSALILILACGEPETKNQVNVKFEGPEVDASTLDTDVMPAEIDQGIMSPDSEVEEPVDVETPSPTVSTLSPEAWETLCTRLTQLPVVLGANDEDFQFGYCVGQYNAAHDDYFAIPPAECGLNLLDCVDDLNEEYRPPLIICEDTTEPPEDCDISPVQLDNCIVTLIETQLEMSVQDVCAPNIDTIEEFRATFAAYEASRSCLLSLSQDCPLLDGP